MSSTCGLSQFVQSATRADNVLDIVSSDDSQIVYSVSPGLPLDHSDHVSVNFTLGLQSFATPNVCSLSNSVTAWRKADCESLAVYLHSIKLIGTASSALIPLLSVLGKLSQQY